MEPNFLGLRKMDKMAVERLVVLMLVIISLAVPTTSQINMDPVVTITETVPPSDGYRVRGSIAQDVTLNCFVENLQPDVLVRWQRTSFDSEGKEVQTIPIATDMDSQDVNKWSIEKPTPFSWRLRIKALAVFDEGNYTCFVQLNIDTRVEANRTVIATEQPIIIEAETSSSMTVKEGEGLELMCNASGRPPPNIFWRREGDAVLPGGGVIRMGKVLTIGQITPEFKGRYYCEASNEVGSIYRDIILSVTFSPKLTADQGGRVGQALGYRRTLTCFIDANPQPNTAEDTADLNWMRNSRPLIMDDRVSKRVLTGAFGMLTYELIFQEVQEEDYGVYQCRAKNTIGSWQMTDIELYQTEEPQRDKGYIMGASSVKASIIIIGFMSALVTLLAKWT